uniref:Levopimaradiene synthase n=1 Tax=Osmunda japonica TaxID=90693 RepID=A0A8U0DAH5_9MONI|nr:levopimaradiene synthase [Osmunda japonica]
MASTAQQQQQHHILMICSQKSSISQPLHTPVLSVSSWLSKPNYAARCGVRMCSTQKPSTANIDAVDARVHQILPLPELNRTEEVQAGQALPPRDFLHPSLWNVNELIRPSQGEEEPTEVSQLLIEEISSKLKLLGSSANLASAYDTAWVARVPATDGSGRPQFPRALEWIVTNQLGDGSWGEEAHFLGTHRMLSTLSCVIALKTWDTGHASIQEGLRFLWRSCEGITDEANAHLLCGSEIPFGSMLEEATSLGLPLPYESTFIQRTFQVREEKLKRLSSETPWTDTTALEGLEGLNIEWKCIMKLQRKDGSFRGSPASTAFVLNHTGDEKCLNFLSSALASLNNDAVPHHYPIDFHERLSVVDKIERLGVARFFEAEIRQILDHVYSYWTTKGMGWARSNFPEDQEDDTALAFRLLRLYGYSVSDDAFQHLKRDGVFSCVPEGQPHKISEMLNLYRASSLRFPGEGILEEALQYSKQCLLEVQRSSKDADVQKCSLKEELLGEIEIALKYGFHQVFSRIEARSYIELYKKLPSASNDILLALARADYNRCQTLHQEEAVDILRWWQSLGFADMGFVRQRCVEICFAEAATVFEPEYAKARMASIKMAALTMVVDDIFDNHASIDEGHLFLELIKRWDVDMALKSSMSDELKCAYQGFVKSVNELGKEASRLQGRDLTRYLQDHWVELMLGQIQHMEWSNIANSTPGLGEYLENAQYTISLIPLLVTKMFFFGEVLSDDVMEALGIRSRFLKSILLTSRIVNDLQTWEEETSKGQAVNAISCYLKDHPLHSKEEAIAYLRTLNETLLVELSRDTFCPNVNNNDENRVTTPMICRRAGLEMARQCQFYFKDRDDFKGANQDTKRLVTQVMMEPV